MKQFCGDELLLQTETAKLLYSEIKSLPIIDYHCHLNPKRIAENDAYTDIGSLWLAEDHYKWRAMRLCGIKEEFITGDADFHKKFLKYAEILPNLCGNPLYYWTHMELRQIFGIEKPLSAETAEEIYREANGKAERMSPQYLLNRFAVNYIATTDDPIDNLQYHGKHSNTLVAPTFRPDKVFTLDAAYLSLLGKAAGCDANTLGGLLAALIRRLDFFVSQGCRISDQSFEKFPTRSATREEAERLFKNRGMLSADEKEALFGFLLGFLLREYRKRNMTAQLHFAVTRNVNPEAFRSIGVDSGFDTMSASPDPRTLLAFLASIPDTERPGILLYSLNDSALPSLACAAGAFRNVRLGAAWWFNDTPLGIRRNLEILAEYSALGTCSGMLTDSRSFSSYVRFDFFRRILADFVGGYVDRGEYDLAAAKALMHKIVYDNPKALIRQ